MNTPVPQRSAGTGSTLTVRVPLRIRKRGGRKRVIAPVPTEPAQSDNPDAGDRLLTALARAWRWQRLLESGTHGSISELAEAEGVDRSYAGKVLHLTLLAPDLVEAILDGTEPDTVTLDRLLKPFPRERERQRGRVPKGRYPAPRRSAISP